MRNRRALVALAAATSLAVTACAEGGGSSGDDGGGGPSVEYGATQAEYAEALADMDPITLTMQSTAPKGAATGRRFEAYAEAVEEWSNGKISFEIVFSNGVAPPQEVDDALADGRIDVGSILPMLDPSEFPANNVLWDSSFLGRQTPVEGILQWHGAMLQAAASTDEMYEEYEDAGIKILLPAYNSGSFGYACSDQRSTLSQLEGGVVASQSRSQGTQAEALGLEPASVTYAEMFESLERGVVDCAVTTLTVAVLGGFVPAAPHFVIDPDVGMAVAGGAIGMSQSVWDSLPLAAQQLLYDRLDVLLRVNFEGTWDNVRDGLDAIDDANGTLEPLAPDAKRALEQANGQLLDEARRSDALADPDAFVTELEEAERSWARIVAGLGIKDVAVSYGDFREWYADGAPDLQPYFDELWATSMAERRPG